MRTENDLVAVLRGLEPPAPDEAAVLRRVRRRIARRRILRAGGLAGAASLAAAVTAASIATGSAPRHPMASGPSRPVTKTATPAGTPRAHTAAYIIQHAAAAEAGAARMIQVTRDRAGVDYLSVATQQTLFVSSLRTSGGRPLMASSESIKGTTYTSTLVDYKDRVYNVISASTRSGGPWGAKGIVIGSWLPGVTASDPASAYTAALRKGIIKVLGYRTLNGRQTILIQINYRKLVTHVSPHDTFLPPRPASCKLSPPAINEVWLDASTYLEVQEATLNPQTVIHELKQKNVVWACYTVVGWSGTTTSVGWLPPTKQNLALLNLTPPAGFTRVSSEQIAQYLGRYS
jgi:hypothetical protein